MQYRFGLDICIQLLTAMFFLWANHLRLKKSKLQLFCMSAVCHPFSVERAQRVLQRERTKDVLLASRQDTPNLLVSKQPQQKA